MTVSILIVLACLMAALQIFLKKRIRHNATHFTRVGNDFSSLPPVDRWTLGVVARYLMSLELPVDSFRPPELRRVATLTPMLKNDWGIKDRASLLSVIQHLHVKGHREHCAQVALRPEADFLAWDLMRAVLIAWAGTNLDWISHAEFTTIVITLGSQLQANFDDWGDAVTSYEAGCTIWAYDVKAKKVAELTQIALQTLLTDPASPWRSIAWQTPLVATIAE